VFAVEVCVGDVTGKLFHRTCMKIIDGN